MKKGISPVAQRKALEAERKQKEEEEAARAALAKAKREEEQRKLRSALGETNAPVPPALPTMLKPKSESSEARSQESSLTDLQNAQYAKKIKMLEEENKALRDIIKRLYNIYENRNK